MVSARTPAAAPPSLVVNEIFGPTIQGEGPHAGRRCGFLRLGGCNLSCRWCDTPYTWDWTGLTPSGPYDPALELHKSSADAVLERVRALDVQLLVISGGEPLTQARRLEPVVSQLSAENVCVDIVSTNGTRAPTDGLAAEVDTFVVSPKLAHSGDDERRRVVPDALHRLASLTNAAFKFVARTPDDLAEVERFVQRFNLTNVWIMPEGQTKQELDRSSASVAQAAIELGWNFSSRIHVLLWNDLRGV